jgi:hypothetical protein
MNYDDSFPFLRNQEISKFQNMIKNYIQIIFILWYSSCRKDNFSFLYTLMSILCPDDNTTKYIVFANFDWSFVWLKYEKVFDFNFVIFFIDEINEFNYVFSLLVWNLYEID